MQQAEQDKAIVLPKSVTDHIDLWLKKFPADQSQSAVIEALRSAQEHFSGWLSEPVMKSVADYLKMPAIAVYEIASFYDMFYTEPVGKHTLAFCTGVACMLRGVDDVVAHAEDRLGISLGQTTADGKITLHEVQCMAACDGAPMCQINQRHYHVNLDKQQVDGLIDSLRKDQEPNPREEKK